MSKFYKIYNPFFGQEELEGVRNVFTSGVLTQGPKVAELEEQFAEYVGSKYAVAVNSCTSALFLSLQYEKPKKVQIPSVTFVSVANNLKTSGIKFDFIDKVYVGSYYFLEGTRIIDSAHFLEKDCYLPGTLMCFSFYPTKLLGGSEGGMIATDNLKAYKWLRAARSHGMERKGMFDWDYTVKFAGWKMMMTDVQAAILFARLPILDLFNQRRKLIRDYYRNNGLYYNSSLHVYSIFVKNRNDFIKKIEKAGIQCSVHFKPIHWQPAYKMDKKLPISDWWGKHEVSIPLHENLTLKDASYIVDKIKKYGNFVTPHF